MRLLRIALALAILVIAAAGGFAGEASQGPTAAAIANVVADAAGVRLRDIPLTAARVKAAIGV